MDSKVIFWYGWDIKVIFGQMMTLDKTVDKTITLNPFSRSSHFPLPWKWWPYGINCAQFLGAFQMTFLIKIWHDVDFKIHEHKIHEQNFYEAKKIYFASEVGLLKRENLGIAYFTGKFIKMCNYEKTKQNITKISS